MLCRSAILIFLPENVSHLIVCGKSPLNSSASEFWAFRKCSLVKDIKFKSMFAVSFISNDSNVWGKNYQQQQVDDLMLYSI